MRQRPGPTTDDKLKPSYQCADCGTKYPVKLQIMQGRDICGFCIADKYTCSENLAHRTAEVKPRQLSIYLGRRTCLACLRLIFRSEDQGRSRPSSSPRPNWWRRLFERRKQ